ncbi:Osmotically-inducible protein OsmY, contains BON domain [Collimonas sp. OK242]|jgi:osmotically-inducible protein OsmY|uniref:BON domain-containing protein n=1 Tax=Collimonas sp. OK242 TaxID=1798195 RepID=UPI0008999B59|nr:BON domain-containing protein [Collimonas sp. OK242]SDY56390.1 Osmotically-inducible protein OsmY, contains BON domain [Collimonas sp. OK242]
MQDDAQLRQDVMEELAWEPAVKETRIGVDVKDGIVTLSGHVESFIDKQAAEQAAQRVRGVKGTLVDITVSLPNDSKRTDSEITAAARSGFIWHAGLLEANLGVTVEDGWVTLSGEVDWPYQKLLAKQVVAPLHGVTGVTNQIEVRPRAAPEDVRRKISGALQRQAQREAHRIEVTISGNIATLTGTVHSIAERDAAKGAAWSAPGIVAVVDRLQVE